MFRIFGTNRQTPRSAWDFPERGLLGGWRAQGPTGKMRAKPMETVVNANKPPQAEERAKKGPDHASTATHKSLITRNLRLVYGEIAGEAIPDRLADLLDQIGEATKDKRV